jgi:hypothetical protein
MSSQIPPNPYFNGINFNSSFFSKLSDYLTEAIANSKYLRLIGGILSGNLGIKRTPAVELDVNGKAIIHTGLGGTPVNGLYGGDGTRLILWPGAANETAYAFGIAPTTLWYGVPAGAKHIFYTGIDERMRIKGDGNVGIGTNDPVLKLDVRGKAIINDGLNATPINGSYGGDGTKIVLWPVTGDEVPFSLGIGPATLWYACPSASKHEFYIGTVNVASFTRGSFEILTLKSPSNTNYQLLFAPPSATTGAAIQTIQQGSGYSQDLTLQQQGGNVGIGTTNPDNIFQVGNGGRLRISNGISDYTSIGSKDTDDANNTRIVISGNTRTVQAGNIAYVATGATGAHVFYKSGNSIFVDWDDTDCTFYNSITTIGANYYTDGEYLLNTTKRNTGGTLKTGYFLSLEWFYNSLLNIAFSHNDSTYTYWHGNIGTNNSTAPIYITALAQNNATIESFQEQTTNVYWIYFRPTSSYNASVQLRVKFYG